MNRELILPQSVRSCYNPRACSTVDGCSALHPVFRHLNRQLVGWIQGKYKRFRTHEGHAWHWLRRIAKGQPELFAYWKAGITP